MATIGVSKPYYALYQSEGGTVSYQGGGLMGKAVELSASIEAGEEIRKARAEGKAVIGETCPHYLVLDKHKMDHPDWHIAARWICSPALRDKEDQDYPMEGAE